MGLNLTEDNYSYATSYSADNHYGYHLNEVDKVVSYGTIVVVDSTDGAKNLYDIDNFVDCQISMLYNINY